MSIAVIQDEFADLHFHSEDYQLKHKIGQGGFGSVFKAIHKKTKQSVAIKFLQLTERSDPKHRQQQIARFERESTFVCQLSHPHIVRLLDKGRIDDNNVYSVFEYVDGISLSDYIKQQGALSVEETHSIMLQILDALVHAHQQGIIHRDIKPSNIMLSRTGAKHHVKLLDFGISTLTLGQRAKDYLALTITQESIGTPTYCAPEQLRGELTTFSSDLYMWGLVFIECLTGVPAMSGASVAELYHKHLNDIPVPIPAPLHSHPLGQLLQRCLRKNASERVNSAQTLYHELSELVLTNLVGRFLPATPPTPNDDTTLVLRQDDPNSLPASSTQSTERKQITTLALRIRVNNMGDNASEDDVIESLFQSTRRQFIDVAQRYGGFHVGNLSGFCVFYFGYPIASDHDARLAARTALEMISLNKKQQSYMHSRHGCEFQLNIGIHTGILVKHGNQVPDGFASHHASDLALQNQNQGILCSLDSKAILDNYYQFSENKSQENERKEYAQLIAERAIEAFGFIRGVRNTYPLIGREKELAILHQLNESFSPHKATHVYGEAGIGKSRLIHEFRRLKADKNHRIFQSLPEHQNNALFPVLSVIKYLLTEQFNQQGSQGKQLTQLIEAGRFVGPKAEILTLLAAWLNINDIENKQLSSLEPAVQKSLLFEGLAYILTFQQQSKASPTDVYIFEDIHWADSTTLEFIVYLTQQDKIDSLITTSRQPLPTAFADDKTLFNTIQLGQLTATSTETFIHALFDGAPLSNAVMTLLVTRTDGIPLFIEELVFMLKRRKLVQFNKGVLDFVDPEKIDEIPSSLRESIQNKIDGLIYAKDTLQLAAAIGRQFDYNLLVAASHFSELQVQNDLSELIENQLIIQLRHVDGDRYLFKHALVRDAGYDSMTRKARLERHELIAESIISTTETIDRFVATDLAQHYEKAQQYDQASQYYYQAASEAETTFAIEDAIHLYQSALTTCHTSKAFSQEEQQKHLTQVLEGLSKSLIRDGKHNQARSYLEEIIFLLKLDSQYERLASIQILLGKTYEVVHQHNDALKHYQKAYKTLLKASHSDVPDKSTWWKTWLELKRAIFYIHYWLGNSDEMKPILAEMETVVEAAEDQKQNAEYYHAYFQLQLRTKRYVLVPEDLNTLKKALKSEKLCEDPPLFSYIMFSFGLGLILSNQPKESIKKLNKALKLAKTFKGKVLQTRCYTYLAVAYRKLNNINKTKEYAEMSLILSREIKMDDYIALALANLSWTYFSQQDYQQSSVHMEQSLAQWCNMETRFEYPMIWLSHLHAIALFGTKKYLTRSQKKQISELATTLLGPQQMPLSEPIPQLLCQLQDTLDNRQCLRLIKELTKIAKKENLI